jgi:hypothetical protein
MYPAHPPPPRRHMHPPWPSPRDASRPLCRHSTWRPAGRGRSRPPVRRHGRRAPPPISCRLARGSRRPRRRRPRPQGASRAVTDEPGRPEGSRTCRPVKASWRRAAPRTGPTALDGLAAGGHDDDVLMHHRRGDRVAILPRRCSLQRSNGLRSWWRRFEFYRGHTSEMGPAQHKEHGQGLPWDSRLIPVVPSVTSAFGRSVGGTALVVGSLKECRPRPPRAPLRPWPRTGCERSLR